MSRLLERVVLASALLGPTAAFAGFPVPEMDGGDAALALALAGGLVALIRARRRARR